MKLTELGEVAATPNGYAVQSVWLQIANKAMEQMHKFMVEFGFTPASRTRVKTEIVEKEKSLAEILFENEDAHRE
jgi:phage terminase small subunit